MALPWDVISENVLNVSKVLNDVVDTVHEKDVEWVVKDEEGNITNVEIPNLAKIAKLLGRKYIGASDKEPTAKLDGTALEPGDMYYDTVKKQMMVYNGSEWKPVAFASALIKANYTGDGKTTTFKVDGGYNPNMGMVFLNGVNVTNDVDISDGVNIVFNEAPHEGDEIDAVFYNSFEVADTYTRTEIDKKICGVYVEINDQNDGMNIEVGKYYIADTSGNGFKLVLPNEANVGDTIYILDALGTFRDNNLTLDGNGNSVMGASTYILDVSNKEYKLIYTSNGWRVV